MLFDLDDTLLNRDQAVDQMFSVVLEKCYEDVQHPSKNEMLHRFKEYDKGSYGDNNKINVLESLFDEFPPHYRLPRHDIQDFWNHHFPRCFSISEHTITIVNTLTQHVRVGIITNGSTQRQKAKIMNTGLNHYFDTIIISEEAGMSKPDKRIFELALSKLNVQPEDALLVGDDLEKDIAGCQHSNIKGIWFNPNRIKNDTDIQPYAEIDSFESLISYIT
ncbi:HAD family hydrolase [Rossellomorea sp. NPDC071047]|uniref:HAD family hydrolase n=1 Tax=Rossellomorea sp. NPDC071047 TaxID=3390675 RepID=UPI003CFD35EE